MAEGPVLATKESVAPTKTQTTGSPGLLRRRLFVGAANDPAEGIADSMAEAAVGLLRAPDRDPLSVRRRPVNLKGGAAAIKRRQTYVRRAPTTDEALASGTQERFNAVDAEHVEMISFLGEEHREMGGSFNDDKEVPTAAGTTGPSGRDRRPLARPDKRVPTPTAATPQKPDAGTIDAGTPGLVTGNASTVWGLATTKPWDLTGAVESAKGDVSSAGGVQKDGQYTTAAGNHFDLPHVASTAVDLLNTVKATCQLLKEPSTTADKQAAAATMLDKGAEAIKASLVAAGLSGPATALIPGLGALAAAVRMAQQMSVVYRSSASLSNQKQALESWRSQSKTLRALAKAGGGDPDKLALLNVKITTTQRMITATTRSWRKAVALAVSEATLVVGNLSGPTALVGLSIGVAGTLLTESVDSLATWYDSDQSATMGKQVETAKKSSAAESDPAKKATKDKAVARAELALYHVDTYAALVALLNATFSSVTGDSGEPDTDGLLVLDSLGIPTSFLEKAKQLKRKGADIDPAAAIEAAAQAISLDPNPMAFVERIKTWPTTATNTAMAIFNNVGGGAAALAGFSTSPTLQADSWRGNQKQFREQLAPKLSALSAYANKKDAQGESGVKPEVVQEHVQASVAALWKDLEKSLAVPGALRGPADEYRTDFYNQINAALGCLVPMMLMGHKTQDPKDSTKKLPLEQKNVDITYGSREPVTVRFLFGITRVR